VNAAGIRIGFSNGSTIAFNPYPVYELKVYGQGEAGVLNRRHRDAEVGRGVRAG
jgi:hypothetical protein